MSVAGLQKLDDLKVWERVVIIVGDSREAGKYVARIENLMNGGIVITTPEFVSGGTRLRDNIDITVVVTRDDAAYEFTSRIRQRKEGGQGYAILTPPRSIRRVQRRQFVRIEMLSDVSYIVWEPGIDWADPKTDDKWQHTRTIDFSAGGLLIRCCDSLQVDDLLVARPQYFQEIEIPTTVLAICRRIAKDDHGRMAGIEFLNSVELRRRFPGDLLKKLPQTILEFNDQVQDRLSRHLFDKQIELRNKGLL